MLQPNKDRLFYHNLLMPPEGFRLDNAIATSYSLDLEALIYIPVALYFAHSLDVNIKEDVVQVLDSIRRASDTVKVFCQKGQIKVPDTHHRLYAFIEPCVVQVPPTQTDSFHPKIWVIRYINDHNEIKYRVVVLSRNLTFDRSWDVAFQIEGYYSKNAEDNFKKTKPVIDFIKYLSGFEKISWLDNFMEDLGKTDFKITDNGFEDFTFLPSGFEGYRDNILFNGQRWDELLIISPFITTGGLELAKRYCLNKLILFSREFELKKINKEKLENFSIYHLSSDFVEGEEKIETDTEENSLCQLQDLHAKVYSYKSGWDAYLTLGSANCSKRAMEKNVEFMIRLKGKNSKIGPDVIFKELINKDLNVFEEYKDSVVLTEREKLLEAQEQELQKLKIDLVNANLKARALIQDDSNFQIELNYDLSGVENNPKIEITVNLLNAEQKQRLQSKEINTWSVMNIGELDLSSFLIFDLKYKGSAARIKFVMKIEINNLPNTRSSLIFRDLISNTANFFKYIRFLLAENYWDDSLSFGDKNDKHSTGNEFDIYFNEEPLYENMLKAISRNPAKLEEIKKVMDKLDQEENKDAPIIPKDFRELWSVFDKIQQNRL